MKSETLAPSLQSLVTMMKIAGLRVLAIVGFGASLATNAHAQGHYKTQSSDATPVSSSCAISGRTNSSGSAGVDYGAMRARQQAGYDCTLSQSRGTLSCNEQKNMAAPVCAPGLNRTNDSVYSGKGAGRNNPAMQDVRNVGPIPQGSWSVGGVQQTLHGDSHADVLQLKPDAGTNTYERNFIYAHGDNKTHTASEGCVITPAATRRMLSDMYMQGGQVRLNVVR